MADGTPEKSAQPMASGSAVQALLAPKSIAILGASTDFAKINGRTLKALIDKRYSGKIYPVNPKYQEIAGVPCYPSVAELPGPVDLAIVAVPAAQVAETVRELGRRQTRTAIIFSSGFAEIGGEGLKYEEELRKAIAESGVRILGPNCLGLINAFDNVMATFSWFAATPTPGGPVALVSQSGALATATAGMARNRGLEFGFIVATGNECDVNMPEIANELLNRPEVKVIGGFVEGLKDGAGFRRLAIRALEMGKPLVLVKLGRTSAGAKAVASHTAALAGADAVFQGVAEQFGVVRVRDDAQLLDAIMAFAHCRLPEGEGIALMTRSGGAGAQMSDRAEELGLKLAKFTDETVAALKEVVPIYGSVANPVDITPQAQVNQNLVGDTMTRLLADPGVHAAVIWLGHTPDLEKTVKIFADVKAVTDKPFALAWVGVSDSAIKAMTEAGIACFRSPEAAVEAMAALVRYAATRRHWLADKAARNALATPVLSLPRLGGIVKTEDTTKLLEAQGVPAAPIAFAASAEEAVRASEQMGYPVAVKIESADIPHKTEAKGVVLGLKDRDAVKAAYETVMANARSHAPSAQLRGVVVQKMAGGDVELVMGLRRDPVFGMVVMVGLGGIFIEVLKDVAFRAAPVTKAEALRMIASLKAQVVLDGVRGRRGVDRERLAEIVSALSLIGASAAERLEELDLNPVLASGTRIVAVDTLMVVRPE